MKKLNHNKKSVGKVVTGVLIGSVVGATVGWLTAPASGAELRRRLREGGSDVRRSIREKVKSSEGNVARELVEEVNDNPREAKPSREKTTSA